MSKVNHMPAVFSIENGHGENVFEVIGVHNPKQTWNGFACPLLPRAEVEKLGANIAANVQGIEEDYMCLVFENDVLTYTDFYGEHTETIDPVTIDGGVYYPVALGWCWWADRVPTLKAGVTESELTQYLRMLQAHDLLYHLDDPIEDIVWSATVTEEEIRTIQANDRIIAGTPYDAWQCMPELPALRLIARWDKFTVQ